MNSIKKYEKGFDDLVVLGRSAPEELKDGRVSNCLAGWSLGENRFIRIYPIPQWVDISRWDIISVPTEHNEAHDTRSESYKIKGSKTKWKNLHENINVVDRLERKDRLELLSKIPQKGSRILNWEQSSLGIVKPTEVNPYIKEVAAKKDKVSIHNYPFELRIKYKHNNCQLKGDYHDQKCINWGVHRYWDKNPDNPRGVIAALHLEDENWKHYFLIGNLFYHQTAFVIIADINFKEKRSNFKSLFSGAKSIISR